MEKRAGYYKVKMQGDYTPKWRVAEYSKKANVFFLPGISGFVTDLAFEEILWNEPVFSTDPGFYKVVIKGVKTIARYDINGWWHTTEPLQQFKDKDIEEILEKIEL